MILLGELQEDDVGIWHGHEMRNNLKAGFLSLRITVKALFPSSRI